MRCSSFQEKGSAVTPSRRRCIGNMARAYPPRTHVAVSRFPQQDAVLKPHRSSSPSVTSFQRPRTRLCSYMRKPRAFRLIGTGGRLQTSGPADGFLLGTHSRTARPLLSLPVDSRRVRGKESSFISQVKTSDAAHKRTAPVGSRSLRAQRVRDPPGRYSDESGRVRAAAADRTIPSWGRGGESSGGHTEMLRGKRTACNSFFKARICVKYTLKYGVMVLELVLRRPLKDTRSVVPLNSLPPYTFC